MEISRSKRVVEGIARFEEEWGKVMKVLPTSLRHLAHYLGRWLLVESRQQSSLVRREGVNAHLLRQ